LAATLKLAFPEHNWEPWRFRSSKNGWSDTQQLREYFDQLAPKLGIKTKEDWYSIRAKDLQSLHGTIYRIISCNELVELNTMC